jgi:methylated-DNA-[protein]-cysteine S-methyltransferase
MSLYYTLIPTTLGPLGLGWSDAGIRHVYLPEATPEATAVRLEAKGYKKRRQIARHLDHSAKRIAQHLRGRPVDLNEVLLDLEHLPDTRKRIYATLRKVPSGTTLTYGELAERAGMPGTQQSVGTAMGENPCPIVIPCHRVLPAGGKLGFYSGPGGAVTKARILRIEGLNIWAPRTPPKRFADGLEYDWNEAVRYLSKADPILAKHFRRLGGEKLEARPMEDPFLYLARSITFQQLAGAAARTIWGRVLDRFQAKGGLPTPQAMIAMPEPELRSAGLSAAKTAAMKDLATKALEGIIPHTKDLAKMSDEEIIARLSAVRGVGKWTVEMSLMFRLGRADVLPVDDLGVRNGFDRVHGRKKKVTPKELTAYAERWRPYRSVGSWLMWRVLEEG